MSSRDFCISDRELKVIVYETINNVHFSETPASKCIKLNLHNASAFLLFSHVHSKDLSRNVAVEIFVDNVEAKHFMTFLQASCPSYCLPVGIQPEYLRFCATRDSPEPILTTETPFHLLSIGYTSISLS